MSDLTEKTVAAGNRQVRVLESGSSGGPPVVLLHGGIPGRSLYCGGSHMWRPTMELFAGRRQAVAIDLPGCGGTELAGPDDYSIDGFASAVADTLDALAIDSCHLVGTDVGGLVALSLALDAPDRLASLAMVTSHIASPTGDAIENLTLAHPPRPLWSRPSQAWALERLSYTYHHIDDALLNGCVANAGGQAHEGAVAAVGEGAFETVFLPSVFKTKSRFYAVSRDRGVEVPTQVICGEKDPTSTVEHGLVLFKVIAEKQTDAQFHVLGRAGALPFHEEPDALFMVVDAFHEGLDAKA